MKDPASNPDHKSLSRDENMAQITFNFVIWIEFAIIEMHLFEKPVEILREKMWSLNHKPRHNAC